MSSKYSFGMLLLIIILGSTYASLSTPQIIGNQEWQTLLDQKAIPLYAYKVLRQLPHEKTSFTEGLVIADKSLYESNGAYQQSSLLISQLSTGKLIRKIEIPNYFAEGITIYGNKLYQLTYQHQVGFVYNKTTLQRLAPFKYSGEGWGLTHDDNHLIMSQGTPYIQFLDPTTFKTQRTLTVHFRHKLVTHINSLAYVKPYIFANVWLQDFIIVIHAETGEVIAAVDLRQLYPDHLRLNVEAVLNGIAYNPLDKTFYITGKWWPYLYQLKLKNAA